MMKAEIITLVLVLAIAAGLAVGGSLSGYFTGASTQKSAAPGNDAKPDDSSGYKSGVNIKWGSAQEEEEAPVQEPEETPPATTGMISTSGTGGGSSGSSTSTHEASSTPASEPSATADLVIVPASLDVNSGDTFSIYVNVDTEEEVFAASLEVKYDESVISATGAMDGDFLSQDGASVGPDFPYDIYDSGGLVTYAATRLGDVGGVSGSGTLLEIEFNAIGSGHTSIVMDNVDLIGIDSEGELFEISIEGSGGDVNVQ